MWGEDGLRDIAARMPEASRVEVLREGSESAWIAEVAGSSHLAVETLRRTIAALKADLAGPHPTAIERLLIDQIACAWLTMKHAELSEATESAGSLDQASHRLKRSESAQKRYLNSVRLLTLLRAKLPAGLVPLHKLTIYTGAERLG